jgi:hypothetical protein
MNSFYTCFQLHLHNTHHPPPQSKTVTTKPGPNQAFTPQCLSKTPAPFFPLHLAAHFPPSVILRAQHQHRHPLHPIAAAVAQTALSTLPTSPGKPTARSCPRTVPRPASPPLHKACEHFRPTLTSVKRVPHNSFVSRGSAASRR